MLRRLRRLRRVRAYTWDDVPAHLHFRNPPEREQFAILLLADDGWRIQRERPQATQAPSSARPARGAHGYDVAYRSMRALFVAHGPSFARGRRLPAFDSVRVHALLLSLLGLELPRPSDLDVFADALAAPVGHPQR